MVGLIEVLRYWLLGFLSGRINHAFANGASRFLGPYDLARVVTYEF